METLRQILSLAPLKSFETLSHWHTFFIVVTVHNMQQVTIKITTITFILENVIKCKNEILLKLFV